MVSLEGIGGLASDRSKKEALQSKLTPPGAACFAPKPAVIQAGDLKYACNCPTRGWIDGMIWTADEPPPTTATFFRSRSTVSSHAALCIIFPRKEVNPGMSGYFHELYD